MGHLRIVISNIIRLNCLLDLSEVCRSYFIKCSQLCILSRGFAISDFGILECAAGKSHVGADDWVDMQCRVHRVGSRRDNGCLPEERGKEKRGNINAVMRIFNGQRSKKLSNSLNRTIVE